LVAVGDTSALTGFIPLEEINQKLDAAQPKFNEFAITIMNAFQTMPVKDFSDSMDTVFGTWNNLDVAKATNTESTIKGQIAQREFNTTIDEMTKKSPMLGGEMKKLGDEGVNYKDVLIAGQLAGAGLITNLDDLRAAARNPVYARFIIERSEYEKSVDKAAKGAQGKIGKQKPIKMPVDLEMVDDSADQEKIREGYEKARASAEKHYDKLDKRQDKVIERNRNLIDRINEERDARQKVYEIQQKNMDNAVKTVNLQNEIAKAQAEGDLAKAAALKMELKAQQAKTAADARENAIQSREDVKIKAANARITAAETEKKKIAELRDAAIKAIAAREKADLKALAAETKAENERRKGLNKSRQA
ncbi:MAG: hypothetical protein EBU90_31330, partial [Proteobacteria bacterium]|nr:hypothetical protein [Pseudomonadota bacterium]